MQAWIDNFKSYIVLHKFQLLDVSMASKNAANIFFQTIPEWLSCNSS